MVSQCPVCGAMFAYRGKCPNGCKEKRKREADKIYDKDKRQDKYGKFYRSKEWNTAREKCKYECNGLDIFALVFEGEWKAGRIAHHIIEIKEDFDKRLDQDNLIFLADDTHERIHVMYKNNKENVQELLRECLRQYKNGEVI